MKRIALACLDAMGWTLIMWGLQSLVGWPEYARHHTLDVLIWLGSTYAIGSWSGWGNRERRK